MEYIITPDFDFSRFKEEVVEETDILLEVGDLLIHKEVDLTKVKAELDKVYPDAIYFISLPGTDLFTSKGRDCMYVSRVFLPPPPAPEP